MLEKVLTEDMVVQCEDEQGGGPRHHDAVPKYRAHHHQFGRKAQPVQMKLVFGLVAQLPIIVLYRDALVEGVHRVFVNLYVQTHGSALVIEGFLYGIGAVAHHPSQDGQEGDGPQQGALF